jgi:hypothetical protein
MSLTPLIEPARASSPSMVLTRITSEEMAASLALGPIAKKGRKHQADRHLFKSCDM